MHEPADIQSLVMHQHPTGGCRTTAQFPAVRSPRRGLSTSRPGRRPSSPVPRPTAVVPRPPSPGKTPGPVVDRVYIIFHTQIRAEIERKGLTSSFFSATKVVIHRVAPFEIRPTTAGRKPWDETNRGVKIAPCRKKGWHRSKNEGKKIINPCLRTSAGTD